MRRLSFSIKSREENKKINWDPSTLDFGRDKPQRRRSVDVVKENLAALQSICKSKSKNNEGMNKCNSAVNESRFYSGNEDNNVSYGETIPEEVAQGRAQVDKIDAYTGFYSHPKTQKESAEKIEGPNENINYEWSTF